MTESKSTDKLKLLLEFVENTPEETIKRVRKVQLTWSILGGVLVPEVKIELDK
jgi:hypothetical protein